MKLEHLLAAGFLAIVLSINAGADTIHVSAGPNSIDQLTASGPASLFATTSNFAPGGLALDAIGNLYVVEQHGFGKIEKFTSGGVGSTFFTGTAEMNLNGGEMLAFDSAGNLFVADYSNNRILKFTTGGEVSVFADGTSGVGRAGGTGIQCQRTSLRFFL